MTWLVEGRALTEEQGVPYTGSKIELGWQS
jgi:hypothetical protein